MGGRLLFSSISHKNTQNWFMIGAVLQSLRKISGEPGSNQTEQATLFFAAIQLKNNNTENKLVTGLG